MELPYGRNDLHRCGQRRLRPLWKGRDVPVQTDWIRRIQPSLAEFNSEGGIDSRVSRRHLRADSRWPRTRFRVAVPLRNFSSAVSSRATISRSLSESPVNCDACIDASLPFLPCKYRDSPSDWPDQCCTAYKPTQVARISQCPASSTFEQQQTSDGLFDSSNSVL